MGYKKTLDRAFAFDEHFCEAVRRSGLEILPRYSEKLEAGNADCKGIGRARLGGLLLGDPQMAVNSTVALGWFGAYAPDHGY